MNEQLSKASQPSRQRRSEAPAPEALDEVAQEGAREEASVGSYLHDERELRGLSLEELAQTTRIPVRNLQHLEADRYEALPSDVFIRGFLRAYARALGLDGDEVLERYSRGRCSRPEPPPALPAVAPPERGRRFGIAIALVILLILFTLALSIVLQPRHRDAPIELSRLDTTSVRAELASPSRTS